jgi:hypothetical protein
MEGDSGVEAQLPSDRRFNPAVGRVDAPQPQRAPAVRARSWHLYGRRSAPRAPVGGRGRLPARRALRAYPARRRRLDVRGHRALATGTALARGGGRRVRRRLRGVRLRGAAVVPSTASDHVRRLDRRRRWGQRREAGPAAEGRTKGWRALLLEAQARARRPGGRVLRVARRWLEPGPPPLSARDSRELASAGASEEAPMTIVAGFDVHRAQITFDAGGLPAQQPRPVRLSRAQGARALAHQGVDNDLAQARPALLPHTARARGRGARTRHLNHNPSLADPFRQAHTSQMATTLPVSSRSFRDSRPRAAIHQRPSGRSRSPRIDPSTITSPAPRPSTQISPGPRGTTGTTPPHNHSPPPLEREPRFR